MAKDDIYAITVPKFTQKQARLKHQRTFISLDRDIFENSKIAPLKGSGKLLYIIVLTKIRKANVAYLTDGQIRDALNATHRFDIVKTLDDMVRNNAITYELFRSEQKPKNRQMSEIGQRSNNCRANVRQKPGKCSPVLTIKADKAKPKALKRKKSDSYKKGKVSKYINNNIATDKPVAESENINELIPLFLPLNDLYAEFYSNTTQRKALSAVVKAAGFSKVESALGDLAELKCIKYCPVITTPIQLKNKWGQLVNFISRNKKPVTENKYEGATIQL